MEESERLVAFVEARIEVGGRGRLRGCKGSRTERRTSYLRTCWWITE